MKQIKYQKALNYLSAGSNTSDIRTIVYRNLIQELVDKEKPTEPLWAADGYRLCGKCKKYIRSTHNWIPEYCSNCGTKIDWGENEKII